MYVTALVVGVPVLFRLLPQARRQPWTLALIMLFSGWTNVAFILGVLEGHVVRVILLFYLSPIWAVVLGWLVLRETLTRAAVVALVSAMGGAALMLWDPDVGVPWPLARPDALAITAGMAFAATNVMVRKGYTLPVTLKSLAAWLGVVLVAGVWVAMAGIQVPQVEATVLIGAAALGIFGIMVMTVTVQYGVTHMPIHRSAVILLFELVAGAISSQLLTDEVVLLREWLGGALIIAGALLAARQQQASRE